ncbi:MAG: ABC transporter transmembrane domain-containing protein [Deltaproteobacteria bacterium]
MKTPKIESGLSWRQLMKPVWRMVEFDGREVFILLVYTLALGVVSSAVPFASQVLVNQAAFTGSAPPIVALSLIVLGILVLGAFIRLFQIRVAALIAKRLFVRSALKGTQSLLDHPSRAYEFDDREVANRFFDVMTFQVAFGLLASEGLGVVVLSIVGIIILAIYHPLFFAFSCVVTLLCILVIAGLAKRGVIRSYARSNEKYNVAFWISQVAENRSLLRQTRANRIIQERMDELSLRYVRSYFDYLRVLLWQSGGLFFIQALASAAFFGIGGWLVVRGQLNLGQLVAAEIILLANMSALTRFYFYLDNFYEGVVAAWKVGELTEIQGDDVLKDVPASPTPVIRGLKLTSSMLAEPLVANCGDVIVLRGPSRRNCSVLLRDIAASDRDDAVKVGWESSVPIDRRQSADLMLYLARPAILRMPLAENLSLLSDADTMGEARQTVPDVPLIRAHERARADQMVDDNDMSISDRARYAAARVFMSKRPVVLMDMFFNLMELEDQVTFVTEFKRRFPDRILILNAFDTAIDPLVTRIVSVGEAGA